MNVKEQKPAITKIVLNEEQTRRFLSFFIPEAIRIASARRLEKEALQEQLIAGEVSVWPE